jgi:predicted permease
MKLARGWFGMLLRLFPSEFRDRHGEAMRETFARANAERRGAGWRKQAAFLARTSLDLVVSGILQRLAWRRQDGVPRRARGGSRFVSWLDVKLGLRMLVKRPGLTLVATFALAVGIPVGLAPAHIVDGIMAPLPVPDGERIRSLRLWSPALGRAVSPTYQDFEAWKGTLSSFGELGAFRETVYNFDASQGRGPAVHGAAVTASTFAALGVRPVVGRVIQPADEDPAAEDVVVLGFDVWQSRYSGDADIVGRTVRLGERPHTVVGVMPRGFAFPRRHSAWTPLRILPGSTAASAVPVQVFGLLARGFADRQAQSELAAVAERSAPPDRDPRLRAQVGPFALLLLPGAYSGLRGIPEFIAFQTAALLVLLVACVNVGMLMFARMATRTGEMAVRTALGASRARIVTQAFVECLLIAVLAAGAGLILLEATFAVIWRIVPESWASALPWWISWNVSPKTALQALVLAAVSAAVAGVVPAVRATGKSVHSTIQRARARRTGARFGGLSGVLIAADVAVAVGALGFALTAADQVRDKVGGGAGIPSREYLAAAVRLSTTAVREESGSEPGSEHRLRMAATQEELVRRLRAEPGVRAVAVADALPRMQHNTAVVEAEGVEQTDGRRGLSTRTARVAVDYFESLDQPILAGRDFEPGDLNATPTRVIVNSSFVEHALGGRSAVGRRIRFLPRGDGEPGPWLEIVGVVGHLGMRIISAENDQGVYQPFAPGDLEEVHLAVHLGEDPTAFASRLRTVAGQVDPAVIVSVTGPLDEVYEGDWFVLSSEDAYGELAAVLAI